MNENGTKEQEKPAGVEASALHALVMRLRLAAENFPIIDDHPAKLFHSAADALDKPKWVNGEPANIRAAAADAAEWLKTIKPKSPENRRRVNECLVDLLKWIHDA